MILLNGCTLSIFFAYTLTEIVVTSKPITPFTVCNVCDVIDVYQETRVGEARHVRRQQARASLRAQVFPNGSVAT